MGREKDIELGTSSSSCHQMYCLLVYYLSLETISKKWAIFFCLTGAQASKTLGLRKTTTISQGLIVFSYFLYIFASASAAHASASAAAAIATALQLLLLRLRLLPLPDEAWEEEL